jgi:hypothetical protein
MYTVQYIKIINLLTKNNFQRKDFKTLKEARHWVNYHSQDYTFCVIINKNGKILEG